MSTIIKIKNKTKQNVLMLKCVIKSFKRESLEQNDTAHTVNPESNLLGVINYFHVYH